MTSLFFAMPENGVHAEKLKEQIIETSVKESALADKSQSQGRIDAYRMLMDIRD